MLLVLLPLQAVFRMKADLLELAASENDKENSDTISLSSKGDWLEQRVEYMILDHRHLNSVVEFVQMIKEKNIQPNLLICNAAIVEQPFGRRFNYFNTVLIAIPIMMILITILIMMTLITILIMMILITMLNSNDDINYYAI